MNLEVIDLTIIFVYLTAVMGVGIIAGIRQSYNSFWVNERRTGLPVLIFTIVATQVGGGVLVGITSSTLESGPGYGLVSLASTVTGFLLLMFLAPRMKRFGDRYGAITLSEVFLRRYGRATQLVAALVVLFTYFSLLAGQFIAVGVLVELWSGLPFAAALVLAGVGLVGYSAFAGLKGDFLTDSVHFFAMCLLLFAVLLPLVLIRTPISEVFRGLPSELLSPVTFGGFTFLIVGLLFGAVIPLVSMEMWLRVYASRSEKVARRSFLASSLLVIPFYVLAVLLGYVAYHFAPSLSNSDQALFAVLGRYLPSGLLGAGVAVFLAVILSTANTLIVVIAATVYRDLLGRGSTASKPGTLSGSRLSALVIGVIGVCIGLLVPNIVQVLLNGFFMLAVLVPALVAAFCWRRATRIAATASVVAGAIVTAALLAVMPRQAFLPGTIVALAVLLGVSWLSKHSSSEEEGALASQ